MKKKTSMLLIIAIILCIVGSIGQHFTQTNFGNTEIKKIKIQDESGYQLAAEAYVPENATKDNPAPAVIVTHGGNDDKNLMRRYGIELARRGYVAVCIDMYSHGESEWLPDSEWLTSGRGVYDMVRNVVTWPYVDKDSISLLGYSRGGKASGEALAMDNDELNVIKNIYLLFSDPIYKDADGKFVDVYGGRNVMVLADLYDEFFFTEKEENIGTYSNDKNKYMQTLTSPVDYIHTPSAQSFLYFGIDPEGKEERAGEKTFTQSYDGVDGTRKIKTISEFHMAGHYSLKLIDDMANFFEEYATPPIKGVSGVSLVTAYDIFALIGMVGMLMFLVYGAIVLASSTKLFHKAEIDDKPKMEKVKGKKEIIWHFATILVGIAFNVLIIWLLNIYKFSSWFDSIFRSNKFVYIPLLCLLCSILLLVISVISTMRKVKLHGVDSTKEQISRLFISKESLIKTVLLSIVVVVAFYGIAVTANYLLGTIYKFTMWSFQPFSVGRLGFSILIMPMFTLFYVVSSINNDGLGYSTLYGKNKTINGVVTAFMNALPLIVVLVYFYGKFMITGWNPMFGGNAGLGTSIFTVPMIIFALILVSRKIFEKTGNVYLGGFITGMIASTVTANCCEIRIPEVGAPFKVSIPMLLLIVLSYAIFIGSMVYFNSLRKKKNS